MSGYEATPEEIGRLRAEIRKCMRLLHEQGCVYSNPIMKAATLDDRSWVWLLQRLRPAEKRMVMRECGRDETGARPYAASGGSSPPTPGKPAKCSE